MYEFTSGIFIVNPVVGKAQRAFNLPAHLRHLQPLIVVFSSYAFLLRLPYAVPELHQSTSLVCRLTSFVVYKVQPKEHVIFIMSQGLRKMYI
jgi:hypothetical protein